MANTRTIERLQRWTSTIPQGVALKRRLRNDATACGVTLWLSRPGGGDRFTIIVHHRVEERPDPYYPVHYSVAVEVLEAQLEMFSRFCTVLPLDDIVRRLEEGRPLPRRCVALTFDDGYREVFTLVRPLLKRYGLPATLFVTVEALERGFLWPDLLRYAIRQTHEPHVALFSPDDELAIYRKLVAGSEQILLPGGHLMMEVGIGMDERVLGLFGAKWEKQPTKTDLQGIPRTVIAKLL